MLLPKPISLAFDAASPAGASGPLQSRAEQNTRIFETGSPLGKNQPVSQAKSGSGHHPQPIFRGETQ